MLTLLSALGSLLSFQLRSRTSLELELVELRHQLTVLRRQRPGRPRFFSADRLLWTWLYRIWPQILDAMVLVKPATVVHWHLKGFRLLRDRDPSYGQTFRDRVQAMAIEQVVTAPRSPWQNAYVERIIGSIRRECLDHIIVFDERHLSRVLSAYFEYHHRSRTHLSLAKDCPEPPHQEPHVLRAIARAWGWRRQLEAGTVSTIQDIAAAEKLSDRFVSHRMRLAYLAPEVQERLVTHRVPTPLSLNDLIAATRLPWSEQSKIVFG